MAVRLECIMLVSTPPAIQAFHRNDGAFRSHSVLVKRGGIGRDHPLGVSPRPRRRSLVNVTVPLDPDKNRLLAGALAHGAVRSERDGPPLLPHQDLSRASAHRSLRIGERLLDQRPGFRLVL